MGTFLLSISICYIAFSWSYRDYGDQLDAKANIHFGSRALFVTFGLITGIIATSLGSVIKDGIHDDQEEVIDSTCDKIEIWSKSHVDTRNNRNYLMCILFYYTWIAMV